MPAGSSGWLRLFGVVARLSDEFGEFGRGEERVCRQALATLDAALGPARVQAAIDDGRSLTVAEAVALAFEHPVAAT